MKNMTKKLIRRVREALLALPDKILYALILMWLEMADEQLLYEECQPGNGRAMYPELADEFRFALGYRLVSEATGNKYSSVEQLGASDEDCTQITMMKPGEEEIREIVASLSLQEFYHIVIGLSSYALAEKTADDQWGPAPSRGCNGYEFMRNLCIWLGSMKAPFELPCDCMNWDEMETNVHNRFGDIIAVFGGGNPACLILADRSYEISQDQAASEHSKSLITPRRCAHHADEAGEVEVIVASAETDAAGDDGKAWIDS